MSETARVTKIAESRIRRVELSFVAIYSCHSCMPDDIMKRILTTEKHRSRRTENLFQIFPISFTIEIINDSMRLSKY